MADVWYVILGLMLTAYVVLDGFDLGVGTLHLLVAKKDTERQAALRSIGPVWDGNEVWLVATGGVMVCTFPAAYATAFSGFYLPLIMVLWLLIFRGLAIELRGNVSNPLWAQAWDVLFSLASAALAFSLGVALGNVIRGVDLDTQGRFFAPMWSDLTTSGETGILDWYTGLVGLLAVTALALHGAGWLTLRTTGDLGERARSWGRRLVPAVGILFGTISAATWWVAPHIKDRITDAPWGIVFFPAPLIALWFYRAALRDRRPATAFAASTALIVSMIAAAVYGTYPYILPASSGATGPGLTAQAAAAADHGLATALAWWIPAAVLVVIYHVVVYRSLERTTSD
ncbi:MAG: cytochrome d ubiquinol oxidase subunit II [Planctomycetes bacterium]|nr:cytochrome d ubiquinol oxidase subunit II [Planctomycetota bacterium]